MHFVGQAGSPDAFCFGPKYAFLGPEAVTQTDLINMYIIGFTAWGYDLCMYTLGIQANKIMLTAWW